jgi:hypothetical protein
MSFITLTNKSLKDLFILYKSFISRDKYKYVIHAINNINNILNIHLILIYIGCLTTVVIILIKMLIYQYIPFFVHFKF